MDYKNFSGETISEQDKAFCSRVCKLRKRTDVFCRPDRQGTDQSAPLSPQQMFKVCIGFMRQLALNYQKECYDERNKWASQLVAAAYDRLTEDNLIYAPEYTNLKM